MTRAWRSTMWAGASYVLLWLGCAFALELPGVPYNVRELFGHGSALVATAAFPPVLYLALALPAVMAGRLGRGGWRDCAFYPAWVLLHASALWLVVRTCVPVESIWDVLGSPVLHWPGDWELYARFLALGGGISVLLAGGALVAGLLCGADERWRPKGLLRWLAPAIPLLLIAHTAVVTWADTDNLTELMAGGGGLVASVWLGLWVLGLGAGGAGLALLARGCARRWAGPLLGAASLPACYLMLWLGTAHSIQKYGAVFSTLQFLLSPDREHYAEGSALLVRFGIAHGAGIIAVGLAQMAIFPVRRRGTTPRATHGAAPPPRD